MKVIYIIQTMLFLLMAYASKGQNLQTVPYVDLSRYAGKWYEIASYPQRFQKGCTCTTAEYTLSDKGYMIVENRCIKADKKQTYIKGKAFVEDKSGNAKLKVQFFWPFRGEYWIIDLADDYSYAVVGNPKRKSLWILSRTSKISNATYDRIIARVKEKGFDTTKINLTQQN